MLLFGVAHGAGFVCMLPYQRFLASTTEIYVSVVDIDR